MISNFKGVLEQEGWRKLQGRAKANEAAQAGNSCRRAPPSDCPFWPEEHRAWTAERKQGLGEAGSNGQPTFCNITSGSPCSSARRPGTLGDKHFCRGFCFLVGGGVSGDPKPKLPCQAMAPGASQRRLPSRRGNSKRAMCWPYAPWRLALPTAAHGREVQRPRTAISRDRRDPTPVALMPRDWRSTADEG